MLTKGGGVKLLDFGLAKLRQAVPAAELSGAGTATTPITAQGSILGTLHYISPEQLEGGNADARSDIWAFGCVLHEALAGAKAFDGQSSAAVIGSILRDTPAGPFRGSAFPIGLDRTIAKCFEKDPDRRWQTVRDLDDELRWLQTARPAAPTAPSPRSRAGLVAATAVSVAVALVLAWRVGSHAPAALTQLAVTLADDTAFTAERSATVAAPMITVSPQGRTVAFIAAANDASPMLWVRDLADAEPHFVAGTEEAMYPFWSPDGQWIGFFTDTSLKKLPLAGGPIQTIADGLTNPAGGSWRADDTILFGMRNNGGISRVAASGGPITAVTTLDIARRDTSHRWPYFLPDDQHFLLTIRAASPSQSGVYVGGMDGTLKPLLEAQDTNAIYTPDGLLYVVGDQLVTQGFDAKRLEVKGQPHTIATGVGHSTGAYGSFASSQTGTLVFARAFANVSQLAWFDRRGTRLNTLAAPADYADVRLSPDGAWVAASIGDVTAAGVVDVWLIDVTHDRATRFTFGPNVSASPVWSPDGSSVVFRSNRRGAMEVLSQVRPCQRGAGWPGSAALG